MAEPIVLDTSALFTLIGDEPGADVVLDCIARAIAGGVQLHGSFVSLTEVEYITMQEEGPVLAQQRMADLNALPIRWAHSDPELCSAAAALKAAHRLSFADAFIAATALRFDALLIHKDPEFQSLPPVLKQQMPPPK